MKHLKVLVVLVVAVALSVVVGAFLIVRQPPTGSVAGGVPVGTENKAGSVDLLGLISLPKDSVAGASHFDGRNLITPGQRFGRVLIPYAPPEEYDLTVVAERMEGGNALSLGLCRPDRQFVATLDGGAALEPPRPHTSGLDLLDGQPFYLNESTVQRELFKQGKASVIQCSVRNDRLTIVVDGGTLIDLRNGYSRLSLYRHWEVPHRKCLFLGSFEAIFKISQITLKPVSGKGEALH